MKNTVVVVAVVVVGDAKSCLLWLKPFAFAASFQASVSTSAVL